MVAIETPHFSETECMQTEIIKVPLPFEQNYCFLKELLLEGLGMDLCPDIKLTIYFMYFTIMDNSSKYYIVSFLKHKVFTDQRLKLVA